MNLSRILIIEDETALRQEIMEWLTFEGYETLGAADGMEGVSEATQHQPDLILCDIIMPRLDGYGVLQALRANPSTEEIPVILVTARTAYADIRKGLDLGASSYLTKPFDRVQLLQAIKSRLAQNFE